MLIFPAIDIISGQAVRLLRGDYDKKTVYGNEPESVALDFARAGAGYVHVVDLDGAKEGGTPNFERVVGIKRTSGLFVEIGGGVRDMRTVEKYINAGIDRVILGTAAVKDRDFLKRSVDKYGQKIAVGVDIKDGRVAVNGWLNDSGLDAFDFFADIERIGVATVICTDISKDGAMKGTNRALYKEISGRFSFDLTASGGVSDISDVKALSEMDLYAAIIGKAYYEGKIDLRQAIEVAK